MSHTPPSGIHTEAAALRLSPDATNHSPAPASPPPLSCLESLALELLVQIFGYSYSNPKDDFTDLLRLWEQRRTSKRIREGIEATFQGIHLHHTKIGSDYEFRACVDNELASNIAVFNNNSTVKWSKSQSIGLYRIHPGWKGLIQNRKVHPGWYQVTLWDKAWELEIPALRSSFSSSNWLLVDWVCLYNSFFATEKGNRRRELRKAQLKALEMQCFLETAKRFNKGEITVETSLDYHLAHLSGTRHEADRYTGEPRSNVVYILNYHLVAGAFKNCIEERNFKPIKELQPLKALFMSTWHGDLLAIQEAMAKQESESYFQLPLLEIFIAIAFVQSHLDLLSYLLKLSSPPKTSIFDKLCSVSWNSGPGMDNAAGWLIVLDAGWIHPPFPTKALIHYAINDDDSQTTISMLQRIDAISVKSFPIASLFREANWEVMKWAVSQLLASGKEIDSEAIRAAASWPVNGPAAVELLLDAGVDVNAKGDSIGFSRDAILLGEAGGGPSGETALMIACKYGTKETVEALLKGGARRSLRDDWGKRAWDRAKEHGRSDIMELLENFERKSEVSGT
ncbi:ankyrin [Hyaloscypha variabilis F]|uniref:Ankyrin n=1 Tax=Hyaloscypha variabilis (strain UAMH 11265 / GT02V1 / F) TaxID=1149755 RepID=A0A2J6QXV0_HYAVF|nr:ankyrin [Hyaloscypha variabilis F]